MDTIHLRSSTTCIVGILARERIHPQPLELTLELGLGLEACGDTGDLSASVNYASADEAVRFLSGEGEFLLIESLSLAILRWLLLAPGPGEERAQVERCRVRIDKPTVMPDAVPGVELMREAAWCAPERRSLAPGVLGDVLIDVAEVVAYRLVRDPGATWPNLGSRLDINERVALCVVRRDDG